MCAGQAGQAGGDNLGRTLSITSSLSGDQQSPRGYPHHRASQPSMDVLLSRISESGLTPPPPAEPERVVPVANVTGCRICSIL